MRFSSILFIGLAFASSFRDALLSNAIDDAANHDLLKRSFGFQSYRSRYDQLMDKLASAANDENLLEILGGLNN
ncbi:Oidioi.mRNA.OKI2018_I69.PAR.g9206.t1.cds [Oikopleura dioica]|uniref:Oidioi.mRNA.OKI2018_I69.PAR.g9206.t1.cds n=1 Tax=Oikopleura dioica TaxID=34765 RepID=A0ABN7RNW3_OIKDI|nr:Oidioi.mRNA.OKI2018_I69.PAR.g9206.t1.cds [Oikopleura dioica]